MRECPARMNKRHCASAIVSVVVIMYGSPYFAGGEKFLVIS
jgi:hypothetical protein